MKNVEELKAEIKNEVMAEVRNGISELRALRNKDVTVFNKNFEELTKRLDELSGRRKR